MPRFILVSRRDIMPEKTEAIQIEEDRLVTE